MILTTGAFAKEDKMRLAVLDFQPNDVSKYASKAVSDIIGTEMAKKNDLTMVERSQIGAILNEQGFQNTGCTDNSCAVEVGKLLSCSKILIGSLSKLGKVYTITAKLVDVEKGSVDFAESESCTSEDDIEPASRILAVKLLNRITGKSYDIPKRTYLTEEPRKKFSIGAGFKNYVMEFNSSLPDIPYMVSATQLGATKSEHKWHMAFLSIEPAYDISGFLTVKTSFELVEKSIQQSDEYQQYTSSGIESTYLSGFGLLQLNLPFSGFAPFLSGGLGYMYNLSRNNIEIDYGSTTSEPIRPITYLYTPNKKNLLVYRLVIGINIELLHTVDLVFSLGYDHTFGAHYYDGFTVKRKDGVAVDPALIKQAAAFKSGSGIGFGYFGVGANFRIF